MSAVQPQRDVPYPGVTTVALSVPDRSNALNPGVVAELAECLDEALAAEPVALVLSAEGRTFSGGFDLSDIDSVTDDALRDRFLSIERVLEQVRSAPCLTIAVVQGAAIGAGADLAASCDIRIGHHAARFRFPGVRFGLLLGTQRLVDVVGGHVALDLLMSGRTVESQEAMQVGLLSHVADGEAAPGLVEEVCRAAAEIPRHARRDVLAVTRGRCRMDPRSVLARSMSEPGLADRIAAYRRSGARRERKGVRT